MTKPTGSPSSSARKRPFASIARSISGSFASQLASAHGGGRPSRPARRPRAAARLRCRPRCRAGRSCRRHEPEAGEEVVGGQVLERMEAGAEGCGRRARHHRTRRPPCAARGRRPATRAGARGGGRGTSRRSTRRGRAARRAAPSPRRRAAPRARRRSRSLRARPTTYSALRPEKPSANSSSSLARATRSRVGNANASAAGLAVALDEPAADREGGLERDLLRGDRGHERLERDPARAAGGSPASARASRREHLVLGCPGAEGVEVERRPSSGSTSRSIRARRAARRRRRRRAASIRTSRPPTTRCSPPSCQRFARSRPKARKRAGREREVVRLAAGGRARPQACLTAQVRPDACR